MISKRRTGDGFYPGLFNRFFFPENHPALESFLGVKYFISNKELPFNYEKISQIEDLKIGINEFNLPLGFTYSRYMDCQYFETLNGTDKDIALYSAYVPSYMTANVFLEEYADSYEYLYKTKTDFSDLAWEQNCKQINFLSENSLNMTVYGNNAAAVFYTGNALGQRISFTMSRQKKGTASVLMYDGKQWWRKNFDVADAPTKITLDLQNRKVEAIAFGSFVSDENVGEETCLIENITLEYIDYDEYNRLWQEGYNERMQETFNITSLKQNSIIGDITVAGDKMLFFSIPYDEGWTVKIDGKKVKKECINYGFIGVPVHDGYHTIELNYFMPGMKAGMAGTVLACIILIILKRRKICL